MISLNPFRVLTATHTPSCTHNNRTPKSIKPHSGRAPLSYDTGQRRTACSVRTTCCTTPLGVVSTLRSAPCIPLAATSNSACLAFRFSAKVGEEALGIVLVLCAPTPKQSHNLMIVDARTPPPTPPLSHSAPHITKSAALKPERMRTNPSQNDLSLPQSHSQHAFLTDPAPTSTPLHIRQPKLPHVCVHVTPPAPVKPSMSGPLHGPCQHMGGGDARAQMAPPGDTLTLDKCGKIPNPTPKRIVHRSGS